MSVEQNGYISVPPSYIRGRRMAPYPRPDRASMAYRNDLPECATDHTPRPPKKYKKGLYPKFDMKVKKIPQGKAWRNLMVKQSKYTLNPPPADASSGFKTEKPKIRVPRRPKSKARKRKS